MARMSFNPWKLSTFALGIALAISLVREVPSAEAAGPARLGKALTALKASKKFLDEAKDPPAPFHQQSLVVVNQAIAAVEREIKAYEAAKDRDKDKKDDKKKDDKGDKDKKKKPEASKKKAAADDGNDG